MQSKPTRRRGSIRRMLRLASSIRVCPGCGLPRRMLPDTPVCESCETQGIGPADGIAVDSGWRR